MHTFTLKLDGKPVATFEAGAVQDQEGTCLVDFPIDTGEGTTDAQLPIKLLPGATIERNGVAANSDGLPEKA